MEDFKVTHLVTELLKVLGVENQPVEDYEKLLLRNISLKTDSSILPPGILKKLAQSSDDPEEFVKKYDELRATRGKDIDALIIFLAKISSDHLTKRCLDRIYKKKESDTSHLGTSNLDFIDKLQKENSRSSNGKTPPPTSIIKGSSRISSENKWINARTQSKSSTSAEMPEDKKEITVSSRISASDINLLKDKLQKESVSSSHIKYSTGPSKIIAPKKSNFSKIPDESNLSVRRPFLTWNFITESVLHDDQVSNIGSFPLKAQENCLIEDLMFCLEGIDGTYIHCQGKKNGQVQTDFIVDSSVDVSLRELTYRILPLCSNYSCVVQFVEERSLYKYGQVNQALCAAMRSLLKDYFVLIAQLEHQHKQNLLSLQKMWFYLQPTMNTMDTLATLIKTIVLGDCRGGSVLSLLHNKIISSSGDPKVQELCLHLTQAASIPYFHILEKWIYKGLIHDPCMEFLVEDNEILHRDFTPVDYSNDFWEKRYTICRERIPTFLDNVSETILRTGKYLNVIRQCGHKIQCPDAETLSYSLKERKCIDSIEKAYQHSSSELLTYLMKDNDLLGILQSVKHYFLMDKGDFIVQFMDMAKEELKKNIADIIPTRLESLVELALRTSTANHDVYKDNLRVELLPYHLVFQMSKILSIQTEEEDIFKTSVELNLIGLEAFSFNYDVKWPISLILNRKAIALYQMLFRHLLMSKHVERMLCNVWTSNKGAVNYPIAKSQQYTSAFSLCARMLYFVQNLEYYMMLEVLEPNWTLFMAQMKSAANVDDLLKCHTNLLDSCLKDCMLTNPQLLSLVNGIMKICISFCKVYKANFRIGSDGTFRRNSTVIPEEMQSNSDFQSSLKDASLKKYSSVSSLVQAYDKEFTSLIVRLLNQLQDLSSNNYNNKIVNMLYRLDFNGYYSKLNE